jgi:hypothetical protein
MALIPPPAGLTFLWPEHPVLATQTVSSGPGLDGRSQYVHRRASIWQASVVVRAPRSAAGYGAYMAWLDRLRGPVNTFTLNPCNILAPSYPIGGAGVVSVDAGVVVMADSVNVLMLDAHMALAGSRPVGSTVVRITSLEAGALRVGALLTIGRYLYRVVDRDDADFTIEPGLRRAEADGAQVRASQLNWEVRLPSDQAALDARQPVVGRGTFQLNVVEALER